MESPAKELIKVRRECAKRGLCPDCGGALVPCDGSAVHPSGSGVPAWKCSNDGCSFTCIKD